MIKIETIEINGHYLIKTYSDINMMIKRNDGALYDIAIDPIGSNREYEESTTPIFTEEKKFDFYKNF